jgi:hypothetical protein
MSVDSELLQKLIDYNEKNSPEFTIFVNDLNFTLLGVSIENSSIPVNEPTTRGGVYFSEKFAYKMKGSIEDLSVVSSLTKKMLGPNTEFGELKITTEIKLDEKIMSIDIFTNLTNSVQTPNSIELSMIIVKLELV